MKTKVFVTLGEVLEKYDWKKFCEITGTDEWCINEGADENTEEILTLEQAEEIGIDIVRRDNDI